MNRWLRTIIVVLVIVVSPLAALQNLELAASRADAVVVARPSDGVDLPDGSGFKLTVVRTLHGKPVAGELLNVVVKLRRDPRASPSKQVQGECGLFLLTRTSAGWQALGGSSNSPFLSSSRVPLGNCEAAAPVYAEGSSAFERSMEEIALAALRAPKDMAAPLGLFNFAGLSDSPVVARVMDEFSRSDVLHLRVEGVAWRVARGDSNALSELAQLAAGAAKAWQPSCFRTAVYHYLNTDRNGVLVLGRIVSEPDIPDEYLKRSAAHALRNIHTPDTVPYLGKMLDSSDIEIRTEAVSGLTEYVMGVRSVSDGPEKYSALDEAFNPGRRKGVPLLTEDEHLHLGPFQDPEQESRILAYWRAWWETHRTDFPEPQ